jgi:glycerol uptake facilitator-like aquaporin
MKLVLRFAAFASIIVACVCTFMLFRAALAVTPPNFFTAGICIVFLIVGCIIALMSYSEYK